MTTTCRRDCEFYSSYTDTCDYTLLMYQSRGCPTSACTKYKPRTCEHRSWSVFRAVPESPGRNGAGQASYDPEPPDGGDVFERYVTADCGHEVYDGERMYEWEDAGLICPECMDGKFDELTTAEKAALLGCESTEVSFPERLM